MNKQSSMFNSMHGLTEREKRFLVNSWAEEFSNTIFPAINEERFAVLYSGKDATRPNPPVNVIVGALLIKELMGLMDEELVEHVMFSAHY